MELEMNQIYEKLGIKEEVLLLGRQVEAELAPRFKKLI